MKTVKSLIDGLFLAGEFRKRGDTLKLKNEDVEAVLALGSPKRIEVMQDEDLGEDHGGRNSSDGAADARLEPGPGTGADAAGRRKGRQRRKPARGKDPA